MRLIDADVLIKAIQQHMVKNNSLFEEEKTVVEIIEEQPTAYDIEKVVEEIRNQPFGNYGVQEEGEIIDIVRKGGVE